MNHQVQSIIAAVGLGILATACSGEKAGSDLVTFDLLASTTAEPFNNLKVTDVRQVVLDTASQAVFSDDGTIVGILDNTILIHDRNNQDDRVILFSLNDGKYVGELNHKGQGPGEYRWLETVFADPESNEVVLKTPDDKAHRYTLSDSLMESYSYKIPSNKRLAIGSLKNGIALHEETDSGFIVRLLDRNFRQTDSIKVTGYKIGWQAGLFTDFGDDAVISMADTLYAIRPGHLEKLMILHRGGKTILPETEEELSKLIRSDKYETYNEKQAENITLALLLTDGRIALLIDNYAKQTGLDLFRMSNGEHLGRFLVNYENMTESGIPVEYEGTTLYVIPSYVDDGRWYAIYTDEEKDEVSVISFLLDTE